MADDNPFSDPSLQAADQRPQQEELPSWATAPRRRRATHELVAAGGQ